MQQTRQSTPRLFWERRNRGNWHRRVCRKLKCGLLCSEPKACEKTSWYMEVSMVSKLDYGVWLSFKESPSVYGGECQHIPALSNLPLVSSCQPQSLWLADRCVCLNRETPDIAVLNPFHSKSDVSGCEPNWQNHSH